MSFSTIEEATEAYEKALQRLEAVESTAETRKQERIKLQQELSEFKKKIEGVDLDRFKELETEAEKRRKEELEAKGKYDELAKEKDELIAQLQNKLTTAQEAQEKAIASSIEREKKFHLGAEFIKAGGIPEQLDNFLAVGSDLFKYELGEDGSKGALGTSETLLGEDNKQITGTIDALKHYSKSAQYGVFFKAENNADSGPSVGGNPGGSESSPLSGKSWV